jgi:dihydrofolate synthase/folylpolyglutamate synthase
MIPRKFVSEFIREYKSYFDSFNPSFFEILVYMAFLYFVKNKVDIAVIEVGLGGRLDATNIITPELAVITNIGLDHTDILGNSLEKIAAEKAGIIKKNRPVIIGETQDITLPVFSAIADNMHAPLYVADQLFQINYSLLSVDNYQVFNVKKNGEICYINLKCGLLGHYQRKNTVTVLGAVDLLQKNGLKIRERDIYAGIRKVIPNTGLMGRWQIIRHHPTVICDTAHNADGIRWVLEQVTGIPHQTLHLLLGFVNDKNIQEILKYMPVNAHYYFNRLSVPRTMDEHKLAAMAQQHNLKGDAYTHIREAMNDLMKTAGPNDLAVITGSNFLVADFLEIQGKKMEK